MRYRVSTQYGRQEFGPEVDFLAAMEVRGYEFERVHRNPTTRKELQGQPVFAGLYGPMWDGDAVRYESHERYLDLSCDDYSR